MGKISIMTQICFDQELRHEALPVIHPVANFLAMPIAVASATAMWVGDFLAILAGWVTRDDRFRFLHRVGFPESSLLVHVTDLHVLEQRSHHEAQQFGFFVELPRDS